MNIDRQLSDARLRAALGQEAAMLNAPEPDLDRLISGGKVRQRRRNLARMGGAVTAAVLVAGGVYGITNVDFGTGAGPSPAKHPSSTSSPTTSPQVYKDNGGVVKPGTYKMLVGVDASEVPIDADLTLYQVWGGGNYPVLRDTAKTYGGVAVYQPTALAAGTGCLGGKSNANVGQTPRKLAQQLAQLPRSTVVQPPTPVQAFGHPAVHLQLRIDPTHCFIYRVAETLRGGHGISFGKIKKVLIDFWVENIGAGRPKVDDVGGVPVVVETWHQIGASSQMLSQIARTKDSIKLVTGG